MNAIVYGINDSISFSGGRLHAWFIAEALAELGFGVFYITNAVPAFYDDFSLYPKHSTIKIININNTKELNYIDNCKLFFLIPDFDSKWYFYGQAVRLSLKFKSILILVSFETPNWFNIVSLNNRNERLWKNWKLVSKFTDVILSLTNEGNKYAIKFFHNLNLFYHLAPPINSKLADGTNINKKKNKF